MGGRISDWLFHQELHTQWRSDDVLDSPEVTNQSRQCCQGSPINNHSFHQCHWLLSLQGDVLSMNSEVCLDL